MTHLIRAPMALRLDFVPMHFTLIQLLSSVESQRTSCGRPFTVVDDEVDIAVVVIVAKGAAARGIRHGDAGAALLT